jgi:hypothetical protein
MTNLPSSCTSVSRSSYEVQLRHRLFQCDTRLQTRLHIESPCTAAYRVYPHGQPDIGVVRIVVSRWHHADYGFGFLIDGNRLANGQPLATKFARRQAIADHSNRRCVTGGRFLFRKTSADQRLNTQCRQPITAH